MIIYLKYLIYVTTKSIIKIVFFISEVGKNTYKFLKIPKINKRSIPNKCVAMRKILKINKRSAMFIWQTRVYRYSICYFL